MDQPARHQSAIAEDAANEVVSIEKMLKEIRLELQVLNKVSRMVLPHVTNQKRPNTCVLCGPTKCDSLLELHNKLSEIFQTVQPVAAVIELPEANANDRSADEISASCEVAAEESDSEATNEEDLDEEHEESKSSTISLCYCGQDLGGEMIQCEDPMCEFVWFHTKCVPVKNVPSGKWYCPECKAQRAYDNMSSKRKCK